MTPRPANSQAKPASSRKYPFLKGLLTGLVAGVGLSAGVALYVTHMPNPFIAHSGQATTAPDRPAVEMPNISRQGLMNPSPVTAEGPPSSAAVSVPEATPLPAAPASSMEAVPQAPSPGQMTAAPLKTPEPAAPQTVYFVQTGAFGKAEEADNQRANLALLGMDSTVLSPEVGDKLMLYRVRIGPIRSVDEVRTVVATLKNNGIVTNVIKSTSGGKPKDTPSPR